MLYYEILVIASNMNSHYEGRFFIQAMDKSSAVAKVMDFLEITEIGEFKFYTRELSKDSYKQNLRVANDKKQISNRLLSNFCNMNIENLPFYKVTSTSYCPEFVDLSYFN